MKLFEQTCDRFQIPGRAPAALPSALLRDFEIVIPERRNCSLIKAKSGMSVSNKEERFRAVIARWHHNQCKVSILILERTRP